MRTAVIVIGDLGRSPRMQYHAASLAGEGEVDLIGLDGAPVITAVSENPRIRCHRVHDRSFADRHTGGVQRFVWASALRAVSHGVRLFTTLMRIPKPDVILAQNPPALPTLPVAWLAARLRGARLVIDWHNLSHTIAAVKVGDHHRAVRSLARSERRWAARADGHLAVSKAMAEWLSREYRIAPAVVYDRPAAAFVPPSAETARALWDKLAADHGLTTTRAPIVVCPTSWTPDEDFDLLLEALERAERTLVQTGRENGGTSAVSNGSESATSNESLHRLAVFLTGRGPLRATFEQRVARRNFRAIVVKTLWLEPADYPTLIGMADLGVCLHQSSSGLDLPMKLADLRGAGVPVAAYDYAPVLGEVLTTGREGVTFRDPGELAALLVALASWSTAESPLGKARAWLTHHPPERWDVHWHSAARNVLLPPRP